VDIETVSDVETESEPTHSTRIRTLAENIIAAMPERYVLVRFALFRPMTMFIIGWTEEAVLLVAFQRACDDLVAPISSPSVCDQPGKNPLKYSTTAGN